MLSAVVLTKNNASVLPELLQSLSWCDETVIVDDDSTDGTRETAKKFGATVYRRSLASDFADQRNFGLSKAKGDWVLFVDSDEQVTPELRDEIMKRLAGETGISGYFLRRADSVFGKTLKYGETANVRLMRLARKGSGVWERPVHEVWYVTGKTAVLAYPLLHFPHSNVAQFIETIDRYTTIDAEYFYRQGKRTAWWQIPAYPMAKLALNYFIRFGFLDGTPGALHAFMMSFHSFLTRAKLWQIADREKH